MISLLIAACVSLTAGTPPTQDELMAFLAANQEQTKSVYARLSYDAALTSTSFIPELNKPLTQTTNHQVRIRSGTKLVTCVSHISLIRDQQEQGDKSDGGGVTISNKPNVIKVLRTPTYIAFWGVVEIPSIRVYFREDWKNEIERFQTSYSIFDGPIDIQKICFGHDEEFFQSYRRPLKRGRWIVHSYGADASIRVQRETTNSDQTTKIDVDSTFYPGDGLMVESKFEPNLREARQSEASISTRQIEHALMEIGAEKVRVPLKAVRRDEAFGKPETSSSVSIEFSKFSDESALPAFTITDMGVPQGVSIKRGFPDYRLERIDWDRFVELSNQ